MKLLSDGRLCPLGADQHKGSEARILEFADLELLVDDLKLSKKHVNVYEPVIFYPGNDKLPVELVINDISKNHIHGYVSEPKYSAADPCVVGARLKRQPTRLCIFLLIT